MITARASIAAAASHVAGVKVTPGYRQTLQAGQGFVRWAGRAPGDDGFGWVDRWQVWLALPQDIGQAEAWLADHLAALLAALDRELEVTGVTPADLVLGTATPGTNGLIIDGARPSVD